MSRAYVRRCLERTFYTYVCALNVRFLRTYVPHTFPFVGYIWLAIRLPYVRMRFSDLAAALQTPLQRGYPVRLKSGT